MLLLFLGIFLKTLVLLLGKIFEEIKTSGRMFHNYGGFEE